MGSWVDIQVHKKIIVLIDLVGNALRHYILPADYMLQKYIDNNTTEKHLPCV